jgi:hypothetical protein
MPDASAYTIAGQTEMISNPPKSRKGVTTTGARFDRIQTNAKRIKRSR